ncbi:MAG: hypothetical protein KBC84_07250 [Proteobacteria bacterium]|nr:hypothetical protein [Pseudomonadota bacterium]
MDKEKEQVLSEEEALYQEEQNSQLSKKVDKLREVSLKAIAARERVPQPLFWSLFHSRLNEIKEKRKSLRKEKARIYKCEWL